MFSDYKARIVEFYFQKRADGSLSHNLLLSTPGKLKDECLLLLRSRNSKDDLRTLHRFCGLEEGQYDIGREIKRLHNDKFRPLDNFLEDQNLNTNEKSIELLALLIDFPDRPFRYVRDYSKTIARHEELSPEEKNIVDLNEEEKEAIKGTGSSATLSSPVDPKTHTMPPQDPWYKKTTLIIAMVGIVCIALVFTWSSIKDQVITAIRGKQCMYWDNDHYVAIDCSTEDPAITPIAIDFLEIKYLKKINRLDTIYPKHINIVHYSKVKNVMDFHTTSGIDPEYPEKHLKPMTEYIYNKYIASKRNKQGDLNLGK